MTKKLDKLDDLIVISMADVLARKGLKKDYSYYHSQLFNKDFVIDKVKPAVIIEIMQGEGDEYEKYSQLIYNSCSFFRAKELLKEFNCDNPYDIVGEVFEDNYAEVFEFGNLILEKYGFSMSRIEKTKK